MLFCFGLFALLLYYTVVANAECSYTYRPGSSNEQKPIEARSLVYQQQGYTRCQFLIQVVSPHQTIRLNFTKLTGFGLTPSSSFDHHHGLQEEEGTEQKEEEKEEEEGKDEERKEKDSETERGSKLGDKNGEDDSLDSTFSTTTRNLLRTEATKDRGSIVKGAGATSEKGQHSASNSGATSNTNSSSSSTPSWRHSKTLSVGGSSTTEHLENEDHGPCLVLLEIRSVNEEGREETTHRICRPDAKTLLKHTVPLVVRSSSSVRIVFEWSVGYASGFTLFYHYGRDLPQPAVERCVHTCDEASRCLGEARMLCDGRYDCLDHSDEDSTICRLTTSSSAVRALDGESVVQAVIISSCAVAVVVVVSAICLMGRRRWMMGRGGSMMNQRQRSSNGHPPPHHHGSSSSHTCLQSHGSESSMTRVCSSHDNGNNEQAMSLLPSGSTSRQHHHRSHHHHISWPPSSHSLLPSSPSTPSPSSLQLPPSIPVSRDGEEGYAASQRNLRCPRYYHHNTTQNSEEFFVRPPPNRTVFDRDSPPPYSPAVSSFRNCGGSTGIGNSTPSPSPCSLGRGQGGGRSWLGHRRMSEGGRGSSDNARNVSDRCLVNSPSWDKPSPAPPSVKGGSYAPSSKDRAPCSSSGGGDFFAAPCSSANNTAGCVTTSDSQRLPLLPHGACRKQKTNNALTCRKTDTQSLVSPSLAPTQSLPVSFPTSPPLLCSSPSSSSSSSPSPSPVSSSSAVLLLPPSSSSLSGRRVEEEEEKAVSFSLSPSWSPNTSSKSRTNDLPPCPCPNNNTTQGKVIPGESGKNSDGKCGRDKVDGQRGSPPSTLLTPAQCGALPSHSPPPSSLPSPSSQQGASS